MKKMPLKKWTGAMICTLMLLGVSSCKVKDMGQTNFKCEPKVLETVGENIPFTITGEIDKEVFPKKSALEVIPYLVYGENYTDTLYFEPVMLRGEKVTGEGQQISYSNGGAFSYTGNIKYTGEEMNNGKLQANLTAFVPKEPVSKNILKTCKKCTITGVSKSNKIADGIIHSDKEVSISALDVLIAQHGYIKEVEIKQAAKVFYPVNHSDLNMRFDLNKSEAAKTSLNNLFKFMTENYVIKGIAIDGWASPEGEGDRNDKLAADRATNAEKYFRKEQKENLRDIGITANGKGANWDGFVSNVRNASGFKAGNTVLSNINSKSPAEREDELRKMMNQYPEIKKEFLPDLRYAEIIVTALEPRHSDGELKEMATAQPQSLKVEELLYAATLYNDFETKAAIYESAAKIYPDQWNALNNAAAANITKGDFNKAEVLLNKANTLKPNQPDVLNNLGVIAAHKGDFDKASEYFKKAEQNNANVAYNQAVLGVRNGEYNAAAITKRTCDYNLALSQMLNKDYSAAQKTLECSEKDSQTYYLMGVIGARTNNKSMMIDNLSKSFKEDPSFKETAAKDAEFINFIDDADFQALLK